MKRKHWFVSKHHPSGSRKGKFVPPRTAAEFFAMPEHLQDTWIRMTHVVSEVRTGGSLAQASRNWELNPDTALELAGQALRKGANGQYEAEPSDRLLRVLVIPTHEGLEEIAVLDSEQASQLAEYWNAVHRHFQTGDASVEEFEGMYITDAHGTKVPLLTDVEELDRLGSAGVLSFESLYARTS